MNKISIAISVSALLMYGCSDKPKDQEESTKTQTTKDATQVVAQNILAELD